MDAMFGLSISKILLTAAVIFAVWYGFKHFARLSGSSGSPTVKPGEGEETPAVEDLQKCTVCGTYVARDTAVTCDRADCPHK